jgi:transposase InsO family protein
MCRSSLRYVSVKDPEEPLRIRLRELAAARVRFGYRRLTVLLRRDGWEVNAKRIYRLYQEEGLTVRTKKRKRAAQTRVPLTSAERPNHRWSMDFVSDRLTDGRWFRALTVVDQFTRECVLLAADRSMTATGVAAALDLAVKERGAPESITTDNELNARLFFGSGTRLVSTHLNGELRGLERLRTHFRAVFHEQRDPAHHNEHKIYEPERTVLTELETAWGPSGRSDHYLRGRNRLNGR